MFELFSYFGAAVTKIFNKYKKIYRRYCTPKKFLETSPSLYLQKKGGFYRNWIGYMMLLGG